MFCFVSLGDPAIEMLKDVVRSEVETLKENFMEEVLGPFRIALKEKLKSIKKEILTSVESTVQATKNDIMKQVDERLKQTLANHAKETDQIKGTSAKKDEESDETDSSDDENLSDIEVCISFL